MVRAKLTEFFEDLGAHYRQHELAELLKIDQLEDVRAFYRLSAEPQKVLCLRGFVGGSTEVSARLLVTALDYDTFLQLSTDTNKDERFSSHRFGIKTPYDVALVDRILRYYHSQLRDGRSSTELSGLF